MMNIAIVHELLTMKGGAERVAKIFTDMFPDAPIYTLLYDEKKLGDWFPKERVRVSSIKTFGSKNHHLYLSRFPAAVEAWDFSEFDVVLSSSSAFVHGIITNGKPKHICYVQSPARYLWDRTHDVVDQSSKGVFGFLQRRYLEKIFHRLRIWDAEAADRADVLIAPSKEVQRRIELYWRKQSTVINPPIDDAWFDQTNTKGSSDYFLIVSTLARYKRIDLAIKAANTLNAKLKIAGEGPEKKRLMKIAGSTIEFLDHQSIHQLTQLYANATATIFPGEEDFGLVPLESMACGTPVIAYRKGGALETVDDQTGIFFDEATPESLANAMKDFSKEQFNADTLKNHAKKFSRNRFEEEIRSIVQFP